MSNTQLETAKQLSIITGRPLSDFYKLPEENVAFCSCGLPWNSDGVCHGNHETGEQAEEERVEETEDTVIQEVSVHVREVRDNEEKTSYYTDGQIDDYIKIYGGEPINGKLLNTTRRMTRKEYLAEKKKFKEVDEFWQSPLIYLMFRSEDQMESNFVNWTTSIEKDIIKNEKKK